MERKILTCLKCGWKWFPRKETVYLCPKCHSPKWNEQQGELQ